MQFFKIFTWYLQYIHTSLATHRKQTRLNFQVKNFTNWISKNGKICSSFNGDCITIHITHYLLPLPIII